MEQCLMDKQKLINLAASKFKLDINSTHGLSHWQRVEANGLLLGRSLPLASVNVITHFAYLHDACREDEWEDPQHGRRSADWCQAMWQDRILDLTITELKLPKYACRHHTEGKTQADVTVQTCWDADRLDIGRVGITPAARFLCTLAAKDMLANVQAKA